MKRYNYSTFANIVKKFNRRKLLVIGDLLLDQYIWGDVSRISPEAPVPVVWVRNDRCVPGGACNVACNLANLGADVSVVGVVGGDERAAMLRGLLEEKNISLDGIFTDKNRPTILKTRITAGQNEQQVLRVDRENIDPIPNNVSGKMIDYIKNKISSYDGIIIEDYGKGLITPSFLKPIIKEARKRNKIISVDPKENHFSSYRGVSVITPNHKEAERAVNFKIDSRKTLQKAGAKLLSKLKADVILITLGEKGMILFERDKRSYSIPTIAQEVFDVSGAGDTVIAVYTLALVSGGSPRIAAHISNCAAGIVVGHRGTAVVGKKELLASLKRETEKG